MKQVLQNLRSGATEVVDVPAPVVVPGRLLIRTRASLISAGTERMLVEFSRAGFIGKAKAQPEKVQQVIDKIRADGLLPTLEAVFNKLDEPLPLGYCNVGVVVEGSSEQETGDKRRESGAGGSVVRWFGDSVVRGSGDSVVRWAGDSVVRWAGDSVVRWAGNSVVKAGDRVVSNGPHAEFVSVPYNLCARVPDNVSDEQAAFTVLASIGLQGIRLLEPTLGERFVVYGLGLIGQLCVQMLRANGCEVLGIDINPDRLALAERFGARVINPGAGADPVKAAMAWTGGRGVDGVLITASAKTDEIVHCSAQMCRKRGRIVLVGVVGLNLRRSDFYEKELRFQVSCSYGPGRYDEKYEQGGHDYPLAYVRWTEQRNFEAVLDMLATGRLNVDPLITHRYPLEKAVEAYDIVAKDPKALGVILQYPVEARPERRVIVREQPAVVPAGRAVVGVIGAGNFSKMTLVPALARTGADLRYVCDLNGAAAAHLARKYGVARAVTDYKELLEDPAVNAVFIAVGHNLHARFACEALEAGKHVYVEKPMALCVEEIQRIVEVIETIDHRPETIDQGQKTIDHGPKTIDHRQETMEERGGAGERRQEARDGFQVAGLRSLFMVGFNRRFSPHTVRILELLEGRSEPLAMTMTVNAGFVPPDHWVHDPVRGGGRIIGEACHFIDLMVCLTGSLVKTVAAVMMDRGTPTPDDKMSILLGFEDGSVGTINYFANGARAYPKETLEVFSEGRVVRLENFRRTIGFGFKGFRRFSTWRQDKGHAASFAAFIRRVEQGGPPLISLAELVNVTLASFAAVTAAREKRVVQLREIALV